MEILSHSYLMLEMPGQSCCSSEMYEQLCWMFEVRDFDCCYVPSA